MSKQPLEVEIKIALHSVRAIRARLRRIGFRLSHPREFESNTLLDSPDGTLRAAGRVLRLRQFGPAYVVTFKGKGTEARHKIREELEFRVDSLDAAAALFDRLGYQPSFRYEKFRTTFSDGEGEATIDETPIGNYLELEGAPDWIDRTAAALCYKEDQYITLSYGRLYMDYCQRVNEPPSHMVFSRNTEGTYEKSP